MWQKSLTESLRDEIEEILSVISSSESLSNLVREPLLKVGRGLEVGESDRHPWPLLPLVICESMGGSSDPALPVAAAFQFFLAAGDVFDDIEDADSGDSLCAKYGISKAVSAANTLLILGERGLTRLRLRGVKPRVIAEVMDTFNSFYTSACLGQHLDLELVGHLDLSEERYLNIIGLKSASQLECACRAGALVGGAKKRLLKYFSEFGRNCGLFAQIDNDIRGITGGKDILKPRITLPVIFALEQAEPDIRERLVGIYSHPAKPVENPQPVKELLFRCGVIYYATIKMEYYKQLALEALIKAEKEGARVEQLKTFLE
jgi:geranylgeranyl pyrophosphate synthase